MVGLRDAVGNAVKEFMCSAASQAAPFRAWLERSTPSVTGVGSPIIFANDAIDGAAALACPPQFGGGASGGGGAVADFPPVQGEQGKCDGVLYDVTFSYVREDGQEGTQGPIRRYGPIGPLEASNDFRAWCFFNRGDAGFGSNPPQGYACRNIFSTSTGLRRFDYQFVNIVRADGQPDDCGEEGEQEPPTGDVTINYDIDNTNVDVDITIRPTFPVILPSGALIVNFDVDLPDFTLSPTFDFSTGDVTFNFGGNPESSPCCQPPEIEDEQEDEEDPPPPEDNRRLWGVKVNCTLNRLALSATEVGTPGGPSLFIPRLAVVRFAIEIGGQRAWTIDQPVKTTSQFIPVNAPAVAYDYAVTPEDGVTVEVKGIYVKDR